MKCFNHPDLDSVGICKACGKGLCGECVTDLGHVLACKDRHEENVRRLNDIVVKNARMLSAGPKNILIAPAFFLFLGSVLAGYGFFSNHGVKDPTFVMGVGILVFSVVLFMRGKAMYGNDDTEPDQ